MKLIKPSLYNHRFSHSTGWLLFNGVSNALVVLSSAQLSQLADCLDSVVPFDISATGYDALRKTITSLHQGNFFVDADLSELDRLRATTKLYKSAPILSLTIAPTMNCNLGCYYCFEDHYPSLMSRDTCDSIIEHVKQTVRQRAIKVLKIMWFGGEPMLHPEAITYLSNHLIAYCAEQKIKFDASMISNGTCWPEDDQAAKSFLRNCDIKHLQFTFDGLEANHNKRRRMLDGNAPLKSFDAIVATIGKVRGLVNLYLRVNCDPGNFDDAYQLIDMFVERGWLYPGSHVYPYPAQIRPHNTSCDFLHKGMLDDHQYNKFAIEFLRRVSPYEDAAAIAHQAIPRSLKVACGAVNPSSIMIGPDGELYRCIADYGISDQSHGNIRALVATSKEVSLFSILPSSARQAGTPNDYLSFDTYAQTNCSVCKYLPQCLSGCAKQHLETQRPDGNRANIDSFKRFWDDSFEDRLKILADSLLRSKHDASGHVPREGFEGEIMDTLVSLGGGSAGS